MDDEEAELFFYFSSKVFFLLYRLKQPCTVYHIINQHGKIFLLVAQESIENTFSMT